MLDKRTKTNAASQLRFSDELDATNTGGRLVGGMTMLDTMCSSAQQEVAS